MTLADVAPIVTESLRGQLLSDLVIASRRSQEALIRAVSNNVYETWMRTALFQDADLIFAETYATMVRAAQIEAHTLTLASIAEHASLAMGRTVTAPAVTLTDAAWLETASSFDSRLAIISRNTALSKGVEWVAASENAGRVSASRSSRAIQAGFRAAGNDWSANAPPSDRPRGWRKVTSGAACGWCTVVADQIYSDAGTVSSHDFDRCGFSPVFEGDGWNSGQLKADGRDYREVQKQPASPEAATIPKITDSTTEA